MPQLYIRRDYRRLEASALRLLFEKASEFLIDELKELEADYNLADYNREYAENYDYYWHFWLPFRRIELTKTIRDLFLDGIVPAAPISSLELANTVTAILIVIVEQIETEIAYALDLEFECNSTYWRSLTLPAFVQIIGTDRDNWFVEGILETESVEIDDDLPESVAADYFQQFPVIIQSQTLQKWKNDLIYLVDQAFNIDLAELLTS